MAYSGDEAPCRRHCSWIDGESGLSRRAEDIHHSLNRLHIDLYSPPLEDRKLQLAGVFRNEISVFVAHRSVQVDLSNAPPSRFQEQLI